MKKPKSKPPSVLRKKSPEKDSHSERTSFPIVGIGASAGGLEACTDLLKHLPADTGMAFVLVQHLDPQHESALSQILARSSSLLVREASNNLEVEPNCLYVIPPNTNLIITKLVLRLTPRQTIAGVHRSIDLFLKSLAQDHKEYAIGIILSGTASDGAEGLEMIKSEGGITFAQDSTAKYDSMPRHAIASGCVDFVLPPPAIARELVRIAKHPYLKGQGLPAEILAQPTSRPEKPPRSASGKKTEARAEQDEAPLAMQNEDFKKILLSLRNNCGVDFALYKSGTILRRTHRRMLLNKQATIREYAGFLKKNPSELEALYSDLLIGVTSFFRDPEAFDALKSKVFPALLAQSRRSDGPLRVWTLGCSTGQEAYSIAMAYTEFSDHHPRAPKIQIFATDLNNALLEKARHGLYPATIGADMPAERLKRFFVEEQGGYRIVKSLRELCIFARQNVLTDPPFSRLDLISCRNMLIYIEPELQKRIFPTFHFTLKPGGFLFLGSSESIGAFTNLFRPVDKKQKIFVKLPSVAPVYHLPVSKGSSSENKKRFTAVSQELTREPISSDPIAQREADRILVSRFAPPSVVINSRLEVIQFRGAIHSFLEPPTGKATFNVLKMASPGLMLPLRDAINEAKKKNQTAVRKHVPISASGHSLAVNIEVMPLRNVKDTCFLILFEDVAVTAGSESALPAIETASMISARTVNRPEPGSPRRTAQLEKELQESREYADSLQEEHEVANEELQASNEEVQSANEELQSINEELETSKEELESTNEELTTVNEEMAHRNADLSRLNNDLNNFTSSINTAIVLLGRDLVIRRFTPLAVSNFNLLPADIGRPLGSVRHNLEMSDLEDFLAEVIKSVSPREREIRDKSGRWYLLRARPYLTLDNKIDGAVLILTDIDELKKTQSGITAAKEYAEAIVAIVPPLLILDPHLRVLSANESFYKHFRLTPEQTENHLIYELDKGQWNIPKLRRLLEEILPRNSFFKNFEVVHEFGGLGMRTLHLSSQRVDHVQKILVSIDDITERLQLEGEVRRSELRYRRLFETAQDGVALFNPQTRKVTDANLRLAELLDIPKEQIVGKDLAEIGLLLDENATRLVFERSKKESAREKVLVLEVRRGAREIELVISCYVEEANEMIQCYVRDVSERRMAERNLAEKARLLDLTNDAIIVRDTDDKISLWNKGAEELFGWTSAEVIGKDLDALLQTAFPRPREEIVAQLHATGFFSDEVLQIARDGRAVPSLCRWVLDRATNSILTSYTDISERKRMQDELHNAHSRLSDRAGQLENAVAARTAELTATNKQLEAFVYSIAHDLRAPLRSMQGFSALLVEEAGTALSETARDYAMRISTSAQFMDALLKDLIAYGGIAEQKVELSLVSLEQILQLAVSSVRSEIQGRRAKVELAGPWPNVMAHEATLGPVLVNLLENALKFVMPNTKPKVRVHTEERGKFIRLWVEDNGIGIAPEYHQEIFKLFTRLRGDKYGGTGVGLAIVRKGLERMSGQAGVESIPNKGSQFWIELQKA